LRKNLGPGDHARGFHAEDGAEALAAREHAVAHSAVDRVRLDSGRREKVLESFVGEGDALGEKLLDFRSHSIDDFTLTAVGREIYTSRWREC